MSASIHVFNFGESLVRVSGTFEAPLFCASDICRALEIENARDLLLKQVPAEEKGEAVFSTNGGAQKLGCLMEAGLYRVVFRSNKPKAEAFRQWVFREVLPTIRRTGRYDLGIIRGVDDEPECESIDIRLRSLLYITKALVQLGARPELAAAAASKAVPRLLGAAGVSTKAAAKTASMGESVTLLLAEFTRRYAGGWTGTFTQLAQWMPVLPCPLLTTLTAAKRQHPDHLTQSRTTKARRWIFTP